MENANVPVMTDQTGQQIVKSLREGNALLESVLGAINTQIKGVADELNAMRTAEHPFIVYAGMERVEKSGVVDYRPILATRGADIYEAYTEGRPLYLSVCDNSLRKEDDSVVSTNEAPKVYQLGLTSVDETFLSLLNKIAFNFVSADGNNPYGESRSFNIMYSVSTHMTDVTVSAS